MYKSVQGYFGVPNVLATFEVYHKEPGDHSFSFIAPKDVKPQAWGGGGPEPRAHMRSVTDTKGFRLRLTTGPEDLLKALVHAMIRYLNLFCKGWLHRDVSAGNVMLVNFLTVDDRPLDDKNARPLILLSCRGILTDGDQGVKWKEDREAASHRSGTLPFISNANLDHDPR
ncbi:hypothetical protein B0H10DRAFT_1907996 [Mycena sp. CBHHK59/15]|nr:hypothetical protein B0H10DRAFT_1907996 [Mycena sp. CBHHK59/15]